MATDRMLGTRRDLTESTPPLLNPVAADHAHVHRSRRSWPQRYANRLFYSDVLVITAILVAYGVLRAGALGSGLVLPGGTVMPYWLVLIIVGVVWLLMLDVLDTRDRHIVGHGVIEYRRIVNATLATLALLIGAAFFLRLDVARVLFLAVLPLGMIGLLLSRWMWRQWLRARQRRGAYAYRAVVVGDPAKVEHIVHQIQRSAGTGYAIVGAVSPGMEPSRIVGVPVIARYRETEAAVERLDADTVIFAGADDLDPHSLRRMGWAMSDREVNWVVAPALTDVAGPRIHATPVAGLPLIHVEYPTLSGYKRFAKRSFDLVGAGLLCLFFSPIMIATVIAIKFDSPGPLTYTQTRVGRRGREFGMMKFRSMVADADDQLASLLDLQGSADRPLFKVVDDPRITRVGRFIRKHSIDELPQLFNVIRGEMSLVGPRPQRPGEVALYNDEAHRRLLVKPGMSGLWQVSGRSALSWDDAIRLDLYYVENWSFTQDIQILFRTVRAVVAPGDTAV